jgi:hypothetical protein
VFNAATIIDALSIDRKRIAQQFVPAVRAIVDSLKGADKDIGLTGLFASHSDFFQQSRIPAPSDRRDR